MQFPSVPVTQPTDERFSHFSNGIQLAPLVVQNFETALHSASVPNGKSLQPV